MTFGQANSNDVHWMNIQYVIHEKGQKTAVMEQRNIRVTNKLFIPEDELKFTASRSSGPGGQNVNKVSTRITLWFDLANSPSLSQEDKERIAERLGNRIDKDGFLRVTSQTTRSQATNRERAVERFAELLRDALKQLPIRKKTRVSKAAKLRRLHEKKQHGTLKSLRSKRVPIED